MTVIAGGTLSLVLYVPLLAVAESIPPQVPSRRAVVWLVGLYAPVVGGLLVALLALQRAGNPLASPHEGGARPHICFLPLVGGPDGAFRGQVIAWASLGLLVAGIVRFVAGAITSARLERAAEGLPSTTHGPTGAPLYLLAASSVSSYCVGLWHAVPVLAVPASSPPPEAELEAVITHELRHASRRDNLHELLGAAAATLLAFIPTPYLYRRYWRQEAECDCDTSAATATSPAIVARALRLFSEASHSELPAVVEQRLERLSGVEDEVLRDATLMLVFLGIGVVALAVAVVVTKHQLLDSLHCMATAFLVALG